MTPTNDEREKMAREAAKKWLRDNDWDYQKYGDRRENRDAYNTRMNYEITDVLDQAFCDGIAWADANPIEELSNLTSALGLYLEYVRDRTFPNGSSPGEVAAKLYIAYISALKALASNRSREGEK